MRNKCYFLTFAITLILMSSAVLFSDSSIKTNLKGNIIVEMTNFKNDDGYALVGLYNNEKGFPGKTDSMIMSARGIIEDKKCIVEFKDVPYGIYAVSGYHDENKNGKLDTGMFGIPKEGTVTSNNATGKFGPAKFDDAKFELKASSLKLEVKAKYY